jgi:hypothetical protein
MSHLSRTHNSIMMRNGHITIQANAERPRFLQQQQLRQQSSEPSSASDVGQWLVHVKYPVTPRVKAAINGALSPYKLGPYVPHNTFSVLAR